MMTNADVSVAKFNFMVDLQNMDEQKSNPLLFPGKASHQTLQRMPNTVIIEAEMDFYLTETTRLVIPT
jgi:hypothetical protein